MKAVEHYDILDTLFDGRQTRILRVRNADSGAPHILKVLKDEFPTADVQSWFRYEYELTQRVSAAAQGVIGVGELRRNGHGLLMELEDIGADTLAAAVSADGPYLGDLQKALDLSVALAGVVGRIHQTDVIHKGLCPANVLLSPDRDMVRIIDFGQASELSLENAETANLDLPLEVLHYIAPEQSGRMNRTIDYRADLYSLGATLFYLFSGRAPFDEDGRELDAAALIHAHIARAPVSLIQANPNVPEAVSLIVGRLLEKNIADRYQSAAGLIEDLEFCAKEFARTGQIADFRLANSDYSDRLMPVQKLFGRDSEYQTLLDRFRSCRDGGAEIAFIHGYSGIGKSALVNELQRPIALANGYFVVGKFDVNLRDQPYGGILQALRALVGQRLLASRSAIGRLAEDLKAALGPNGQIIIDAIPEVQLIIGEQPQVPDLGPEESQNRFGRVIESFLQVMASADHPLVVFIDDLQWADLPSLNLMRRITSGASLHHLLLIGAYRSNEVGPAHPVSLMREALQEQQTAVTDIELGPLRTSDVADLISAMIRLPLSESDALITLCYEKTGGNPFFLNQFLLALNNDGLLTFDYRENAWQWDMAAIERRDYTDNVVDLVVARIRRMPGDAAAMLKIAACIGSRFDLLTLSEIAGMQSDTAAQQLWPLLQDNLIMPVSQNYRVAHGHDGADAEAGANVTYRFLHDRVQQAAYGLQTEDERRQTHLVIARTMHRTLAETSPREQWFDVVGHFNNATDLIDSPEARSQLAALNLGAARRAKDAAAFESASEYLRNGLAVMPDNTWDQDYQLALDLHIEATESAYLTHDFDRMGVLAAETEKRARSLMDVVRLRDIELRAFIAGDKRQEALAVALPLLLDLGAGFPAEPTFEDYGAGFGAAEGSLAGKDVADLIDLPEMADENARAAMRILSLIFSASYFAAPQLLPLIIAKMVELSGRHGNVGESAFGYAVYGLNLCAFEGKIERGFEFGELSRAVLDRYDARALRARTLFIANICVTHWKRPIRATLEPLLGAYQSGLDTGDIEYSTHSLMIHNQHLFAVGHPLGQLHARMTGQRPAIVASKEEAALSLFQIYHQVIANWLTPSDNPVDLIGENYDESQMRPIHEQVGDRTALFHLHYNKTVLAYCFGQYEQAKGLAAATRDLLDGAVGVHQIPLFHFYESLVFLANGAEADDERIVENQEKLDGWSDHCPENNRHRWHLVEAERCARLNDTANAARHFDQATVLAHQNRYIQEEALAHELHARFWLDRGNTTLAKVFLQQAERCHAHWGSEAKRTDLVERYGDLLPEMVDTAQDKNPGANTIDIDSVLKAAEALSGAIELEGLLSQMMQITIENAGAQRGLLLLHKRGRQVSAAMASAEETEVTFPDLSIEALDDLNDEAPLLLAAARYVLRTERPMMIDDAQTDSSVNSEPYVMRHKTRSVLCMPLSYQGKLAAILYLENDLAAGAFTANRLQLLNMLSAQMAVLIENAQFYDEVLRINRAYERFVPQKFLGFLGRDSIVDVELGDQVSRDMTVMFVDIRDFTRLSDAMSPEQTFAFINAFLQAMEPQVARHNGIVDKYTGDGLMALFPGRADEALRCAIDIFSALETFNQRRVSQGEVPVEIGVGLHSGRLMLGTIGGQARMDGTVISAAVNLASRVESLNKIYGTRLLISEQTLNLLHDADVYQSRRLGQVRVKGGTKVSLFEVFDADPADMVARKLATKPHLSAALHALEQGDEQTARTGFGQILEMDPEDTVARQYLGELGA